MGDADDGLENPPRAPTEPPGCEAWNPERALPLSTGSVSTGDVWVVVEPRNAAGVSPPENLLSADSGPVSGSTQMNSVGWEAKKVTANV